MGTCLQLLFAHRKEGLICAGGGVIWSLLELPSLGVQGKRGDNNTQWLKLTSVNYLEAVGGSRKVAMGMKCHSPCPQGWRRALFQPAD